MNDYLITFFSLLFQVLYIAILARIILSFIDVQGQWRITHILHEITEPILAPIRRVVPTIGMFDFSPLIAILLLNLLQQLVLSVLG
ncbi:YggT family protein [Kallotenue papyrolyticum]|uniref:YggT family protein n=1 Tax=Kallotenue papyrolyticum TaxID=1325125 RepID=UPI0004785AF7|nr:YggT family protein [Kallotenue papyrolyticum]